ncbi:venom dipeptidyl peptidase 4-like [Schistocerca serialis cubense]|uniref:venom dipeptidyl peptidase 4-like n=1 Tax=Schistocerca serialis cubense TaxID=2023355 RepID=UPI00214E9159|nr:venom dipeptidyl peptidase 4-like [Schistocerca serialis cubense]
MARRPPCHHQHQHHQPHQQQHQHPQQQQQAPPPATTCCAKGHAGAPRPQRQSLQHQHQHHLPHRTSQTEQPTSADFAREQEILMLQQWRRDWRTIALAAAVGVVVLVIIVVTSSLLSGALGVRVREEVATMKNILSGYYKARKFNGSWISDDKFFYRDKRNNAVLFDLLSRRHQIMTANRSLISTLTDPEYRLSPDLKYILIMYNVSRLPRSYVGQYEIFDIDRQESYPLLSMEKNEDRHLLNLVVWAPVGNGLAYVYHNNIYYRQTVDSQDYKLTQTGIPHVVYNGVPDSNYLAIWYPKDEAMWFSPNGKTLAYASFNDTLVHTMPVIQYGSLYPEVINIHYPKPGTPIPEVSVQLIDLDLAMKDVLDNSKLILPPQDFENRDPILCGVTWPSENEVVVLWKNRVQTVAKIMVCMIDDGDCHEVYTTDNRNAWVDFYQLPIFSPDGKMMVLVDAHEQDNNAGHFRHVTLVQMKQTLPIAKPLTEGTYSVVEIVDWDPYFHKIYFLATLPGNSAVLHLHSVSDKPNFPYYSVQCLTCNLSSRYHNAIFSKNHSYYILQTLGPEVPETYIYNKEQKRLMVWEENKELKERLSLTLLPATMNLQVDVPEDYKAQVRLWLPPTWDISKMKYPLVVDVFSAPSSCDITDKYEVDWRTYLTVNRSVVYAVIEGRGSGCKGDRIMHEVYRNLGQFEVEDQIHVTRRLLDILNFIESSKIAVWGWNYGGYVTSQIMAKDKGNIFKCGIAVSPITSWLHYHAMYTERYMGLPTVEDNLENYVTSDVLNDTENIRNKKFFLIHGTMDDNVNYQHSMLLAKNLQSKNILFRQMSYADERNDLFQARTHLYKTMEKYLEECSVLEW